LQSSKARELKKKDHLSSMRVEELSLLKEASAGGGKNLKNSLTSFGINKLLVIKLGHNFSCMNHM
jgi:hypothetical protein